MLIPPYQYTRRQYLIKEWSAFIIIDFYIKWFNDDHLPAGMTLKRTWNWESTGWTKNPTMSSSLPRRVVTYVFFFYKASFIPTSMKLARTVTALLLLLIIFIYPSPSFPEMCDSDSTPLYPTYLTLACFRLAAANPEKIAYLNSGAIFLSICSSVTF